MSDKNIVDLFKGLLLDIEDDDAKALSLGLQPPVMAQQQVPQVQIPMAPPAPQQFIPEIQMAPPVDVGQIGIPQPTTPPVAPLLNSDNFSLRPPTPVVLGQEPEGLPEKTGPYKLPDVPKYQVELNAPPTVRGEDQSRFDADVEGATGNLNTRALYDRAIQPLASGGLPTKGGIKSQSILGGGLVNRAKGYFTDTPEQEGQRELTVKVRDYFDRDDVRERIEADPKALALLERDPIGYYQSLTNDTVDEYVAEQPFTFEPNVPKPEGSEIPKTAQELLDGELAVDSTTTQPTGTGTTEPTGTGTTEPTGTGGSNLTLKDAEESEAVLSDPVKTDVDTVFSEVGEVLEDDSPPEEKEGFLKKLWGGMKDMFKEGMKDPAFRKTLFAYVGSKALGYDGVTFAGRVLENEWAKQAKQLDRDLELEKIYGKGAVAAAKKAAEDNEIDYSKVSDIYDSTNQRNISGSFSKDGKMIALDDADLYASLPQIEDPDNPGVMMSIPVGTPLPVDLLRRYNNGQFKVGTGKTGTEANQEMANRMTTFLDQGVSRLVSEAEAAGADSTKAKKLESLLKNKATASTLNSASMVYRSLFPPGTDFSTSEMDSILANGVDKWLNSIAAGREGNAKSLGAFLEREHIKLNATNMISDEFFIVPKLGGEIDNTGAETWIKASGRIKELTSALGAASPDGKAPEKARVWALAERLYKQQEAEHGPAFTKHWLAESDASSKNKGKAASPALLYVLSIGTKTQGKAKPKFHPGTNAEVLARFKKLGK